MFEIKNLKGVYDYSPLEMSMRNEITDLLRRNFELYGFQPLETATLNYRELLTYKYGEDAEIVREIYGLHDQGERDLGLRFDLTVPFCKYIALNRNLKMPFKRYEIGKVFRNGPVKSGRSREFWQCDIDTVGDGSILAEAELLQLAVKCYTDMGILPQIRIGNRKVLIGLINLCGVEDRHIDAVIGIVDKIEKSDKAETLTALAKYMPPSSAKNLMQNIGLGINDLEKLLPNNDGLAEIKELFRLSDELKIANSCIFVPSLARGLNVYTGTVWEVFDKAGRYSSSLGGGGRYDKIVTDFIGNGLNYPAVGMSFGLEPIASVLSKDTVRRNSVDLLAVPFGTYRQTNEFVERLRNAGVKVMLWTANGKVAKALEYANSVKIKFVAVIGDNEILTGIVQIKNMQTGEQEAFNLDEINKISAIFH